MTNSDINYARTHGMCAIPASAPEAAGSPWRPLPDGPLPIPLEDNGIVLIRYGSGYIESVHFSTILGRVRSEGGYACSAPSHWMPLPKAQPVYGVSHCEHERLKQELEDVKTALTNKCLELFNARSAQPTIVHCSPSSFADRETIRKLNDRLELACKEREQARWDAANLRSEVRMQWKDCEKFLLRALEGRLDFECYSGSLQAAFNKVGKLASELADVQGERNVLFSKNEALQKDLAHAERRIKFARTALDPATVVQGG